MNDHSGTVVMLSCILVALFGTTACHCCRHERVRARDAQSQSRAARRRQAQSYLPELCFHHCRIDKAASPPKAINATKIILTTRSNRGAGREAFSLGSRSRAAGSPARGGWIVLMSMPVQESRSRDNDIRRDERSTLQGPEIFAVHYTYVP